MSETMTNDAVRRYQSIRLAAGTRRPLPVNEFGEMVDEPRLPAPVRQIPITDAVRANDARLQRERAAATASAWTIKRELRVENLRVAKREPLKPTQVPEKPGRERVALPPAASKAKRPRLTDKPKGRPPVAKVCHWCGETVLGYEPHLAHQRACPKKGKRRHKRVNPDRPFCASGCGVRLRMGLRQRKDRLCAKCGERADKTEKRRRGWARCTVCDKPLRTGTKGDRCRPHKRKATWLPNYTAEQETLNGAWAALSTSEKAAAMKLRRDPAGDAA